MAAQQATYFLLAVTVFSVTNGVMWARNTQELNENPLGSEFAQNLEGFYVETMHVDGDYSDPLVRDFQEPRDLVKPSNVKISVTTSNGTPISSVHISPNLVIIYTDLIKRMAVGIILKRRTVLTTCVSTLIWVQGNLFSIKPENLVVLSEVADAMLGKAKTIQVINIVAEIRRHPFCGMPFRTGRSGPWMNDIAVLILHAELIPTLRPIQMASENFFYIFSLIQSKVSTGAVCQAIGIEFRNATFAFHGTSIDVRIVDKSECGRLCSYLIPQCEPQIGGYFVQFINTVDKSLISQWMAEAALVCDGKLYGVVNIFDFACDASLAGLAPKPEAVLLMHLSTLKLIGANQTSRPPQREGTAAEMISSSWTAQVAMITMWVSLHG